ncbi:MAG: hypothetical protein WD851_23320 [Pirellulales bacterium]
MPSDYPTITIEALDAQSTGMRIVFEWREDRYHHAIYGVCLGNAVLLAESVEGDSVSPWPPSPPLQQLHKQPRETGGEVLFATGMAGKSHWSGSIATSGREIAFEFACRHRVKPDWLGVMYRVVEGIRAEQHGAGAAVTLHMSDSHYSIYLATEDVHPSAIELSANTIRIAANPTPHISTAATTRWAYSVQLTQTRAR